MAEARQFHFMQCLGSGGFGEVYLAKMRSVGGVESEVAVKVLHTGLDPRSQAVQRLRDEGRLLGALNHPAVLKVTDLVTLDGRVALVMEYVAGMDLEQCFESSPVIPLRAGVEVCARIGDALAVAYEQPGPDGPLRLIHRDVKPPNIRIGRHGDVKLLDFGIAKAEDTKREARTQTRVAMGSPWYMAPERFDGRNDDPASDVYALGCTLFEVVSGGRRLFDMLSAREHFLLACDPARHAAHVEEHLSPVAVPAELRRVLVRSLLFESSGRPTASEFSHELDDLAEQLGGLSLRKWVRTVDWPDPPQHEGALVGRTLTEHRLSQLLGEGAEPPPARRVGGLTGAVLDEAPATDESLMPAPEEPAELPAPIVPPAARPKGDPSGALAMFGLFAAVLVLLGAVFLLVYFILMCAGFAAFAE